MPVEEELLSVDGREIRVTNPGKIFVPDLHITKLDVVRYWLAVSDGALRGSGNRPTLLKRHPNGVTGEFFYQKRIPAHAPDWIRTAHVTFPSGRTADFVVVADRAHLAWIATLGCLELHPWPVRADDVDHPDELRIDVDPTPEATFADARRVALLANEVLSEFGYRGFPKTSGKRGIHVYIRIERRWEFTLVRRAALAFARECERRDPKLITTAWWKEERHGVFIDYNQNARDRTIAAAFSIRPERNGRVSFPLRWDEVPDVVAEDFTVATVPALFAERSDIQREMDDVAYDITPLLDLADKQEREGMADAPYPPQFPKAPGEPKRVAPSRAKGVRAAKKKRSG
ncbi:MAG: non-homologous end-joining DNA ligase [Actinomycetota bacterium]